ncbi:hypothetical protein L9F63_007042, partial [Diploptera punctata]
AIMIELCWNDSNYEPYIEINVSDKPSMRLFNFVLLTIHDHQKAVKNKELVACSCVHFLHILSDHETGRLCSSKTGIIERTLIYIEMVKYITHLGCDSFPVILRGSRSSQKNKQRSYNIRLCGERLETNISYSIGNDNLENIWLRGFCVGLLDAIK